MNEMRIMEYSVCKARTRYLNLAALVSVATISTVIFDLFASIKEKC